MYINYDCAGVPDEVTCTGMAKLDGFPESCTALGARKLDTL